MARKADAPWLPEKIPVDNFDRSSSELGQFSDGFERMIFYITLSPIIDGRNQIRIDRENLKRRSSWFDIHTSMGPHHLHQIGYNKNKIAIIGEIQDLDIPANIYVFHANNGVYFTISELLDCIEYVQGEKIWRIDIDKDKSDKFHQLTWNPTNNWFIISVYFRN